MIDSIDVVSTTMLILKPFLIKAGEKAAETVGEKFANKAMEKSLWQKVKSVFIEDGEIENIKQIESKTVVTENELNSIETKLTKAIEENPTFVNELTATLNLTPSKIKLVETILKNMKKDMVDLDQYYSERRLAGPESIGSYEIMIARTQRRIDKDEEDIKNILSGK
ncbi:hypothetical protein GCM10027592_46790 [Spirosoma flavus]